MSHFSVLVVGDDVEGQLEPFDENTEVEPYREPWTDNEIKRFEEHYGLKVSGNNIEVVLEKMREWNGAENVWDGEADGFFRLSTYNPKSKWDWWIIGGRWRGFFKVRDEVFAGASERVELAAKLKNTNGRTDEEATTFATKALEIERLPVVGEPGVFQNEPRFEADQLRKREVDFDGMREAARVAAEAEYTTYEEAIAGTPEPETWDVVRERHGVTEELYQSDKSAHAEAVKLAREEYSAQPRIEALEEAKLMPFMRTLEEVWGGGREAFVKRAVDGVCVPYAVVRDGQWYQQGEMGWFGMAFDEMPEDDWNRKVQELYDELPDDVMLTIVDCHI